MIIVLIIATLLMAIWLVLLGSAKRQDWMLAAYNKILANENEITKRQVKEQQAVEKVDSLPGVAGKLAGAFLGADQSNKIRKLESKSERLRHGDLKSLSILIIPGYVLTGRIKKLKRFGIYRSVRTCYFELYGKKDADYRTRHLLSGMLSYGMIGLSATLIVGAIVFVLGSTLAGGGVLIIGSALTIVLIYAMYDDVKDRVNKRRLAIQKQFPNVVSKLALLVTSGMIMDKAWKETAWSNHTELYREMQKTSEELDNLLGEEIAYSNFIDRCNTKETTRLASALLQNASKGNTEIGKLLKEMAAEAWNERRNTAKQDSEKANSKLMIPTMLLFMSILIIIMVPIVINFTTM